MNASDRIEKTTVLRAPRSRVWRALTDAREFGAWFGVRLAGEFVPGRPTKGQITYPGYEHLTMEVTVERMDAETLFSYRWHPYAIDPKADYSNEPMTLVEFRLEDSADGTALAVIESGFDRIPAGRRDEAYRMNSQGWVSQLDNIARHLSS